MIYKFDVAIMYLSKIAVSMILLLLIVGTIFLIDFLWKKCTKR